MPVIKPTDRSARRDIDQCAWLVKHVSNSSVTSRAQRNIIAKGERDLKVLCEIQQQMAVGTPRVTRPSVCD